MRYLLCYLLLCATSLATTAQPYERYRHLTDTTLGPGALPYAKRLHLTVPLEYNAADTSLRFPLVVLFDAQNKRSYQHILRSIDYLTANEQMPGAIIVGIESEQRYRYRETQLPAADSSAWGVQHANFLLHELVPVLRRHYHASNFLTVVGHSRTAFFATWLLCSHPQQLQAVVANSPFFSQPGIRLTDSLAGLLQQSGYPRHLYYRFSIGNDYPQDYAQADSVLKHFAGRQARLQFQGHWFPQADHNATPGLYSMQALYQVFEYWASQQNRYMNDSGSHLTTAPFQQLIAEHYGAPLSMSLGILNGKGWLHYNKQEFDRAAAAWQQLVQAYPSFAEGYLHLMTALKAAGKPYKQWLPSFRKSLTETKFYSAEELQELQTELIDFEK